jgi:excisionase family DNA binding protein
MPRLTHDTANDAARPANGHALLLCVEEVAELLACSRRLVWRLASEGALPRVKLGPRCVRFRRADVEALVENSME